jgi:TAT (twin-arginine translocation) pathway signal sequence
MPNVHRRQFLQSSVGVGAGLGLGATGMSRPGFSGAHFANSEVVPGLVRWHSDFATACRSARASGRPVMLLHMLGRLDQQFC